MKDYQLLVESAEFLPETVKPTGENRRRIVRSECTWLEIIKVVSLGALAFFVLLLLYYILLQTYSDEIGNAFSNHFAVRNKKCQFNENEHFRHHLLLPFNRGSKAAESAREIREVHGEDIMPERTARRSVDTGGNAPKAFVRDASTSRLLDCRRVMQNDVNYMKAIAKNRITYQDLPDLPMDCASIKARNYFPSKPNSEQEASFPLAQARIVYKDYRFLEMELAAGYAPQNWYCFAIDEKADKLFHERMHALASCLPNILTTLHEYNVDGTGKNMITSYMECLKLLTAASKHQNKHWKYVSLLQNHDVTIRTNREAVQIFEWMNGANDLEMKKAPDGRVNTSLDWSFEAIHIFRNASKYKDLFDGVTPSLPFAKGYVQASFSRPAVDYMLTELDLTELIRREEKQGFGNDEIVLPTLNAADALALPGGYTHNCLDRGEWTQHITRMSLWYDENKCGSKHMRHSICVFGMEDLTLWLAHLPHLFANKLMPEFDFGAIDCWYEEMFHRSYLETETQPSRLNATLYQSMPQVRFQSFKNSANGSLPLSTPLLNTFDCQTGSTID